MSFDEKDRQKLFASRSMCRETLYEKYINRRVKTNRGDGVVAMVNSNLSNPVKGPKLTIDLDDGSRIKRSPDCVELLSDAQMRESEEGDKE